MRLTFFFLLLTIFQGFSGNIYSQNTRLSFKLNNVKVKEVLSVIEEKSEFYFLFNSKLVDVERKVDINVADQQVDKILSNLFAGTNVGYTVLDRQIIIQPVNTVSENSSVQQRKVSGMVKDDSGEPIPGVSVVVKGTTRGALTDMNGNFLVDLAPGDKILQFSFVGMKTQEITIGDQRSINISMMQETIGIEEVVAVGYGTQKKETLTGSISTVSSKQLQGIPVTNVSNGLGGRLAGLVAVTSSGEPGYDGTTLRIRGSNTFNDNSVLVIIDGVPDRSLERLDPHSIENITVLKDASAAIYGARAANGVILVTTKRGKMGKPELTFSSEFGFSQPTKLPKLTDAATYGTLLNEVAYYDNSSLGLNSVYSEAQIQKFRDGSDAWHYPNTNWFKEVIKPMSSQNNQNITLSGGTDAMKYFVSLGAKSQDGNYYNSASYYKQYELTSNIDGKITKDISVGVDIKGRLEDKNSPIRSAGDIFRGIMQSYPTSVAVWPTGEPGPAVEGGRNPVATSTDAAGYNRDRYYVVNTNLKLDVNIPWVKGLSFNGNLSFDQGFDFTKTFSKPFNLYTWDQTTVGSDGNPVLNSKVYGGGLIILQV